MSGSIATLSRSGLLRFDTTGDDRDAMLTPDGERTHAQLLKVVPRCEERLLSSLSDDNRFVLYGLLQPMITNLPGFCHAPGGEWP